VRTGSLLVLELDLLLPLLAAGAAEAKAEGGAGAKAGADKGEGEPEAAAFLAARLLSAEIAGVEPVAGGCRAGAAVAVAADEEE